MATGVGAGSARGWSMGGRGGVRAAGRSVAEQRTQAGGGARVTERARGRAGPRGGRAVLGGDVRAASLRARRGPAPCWPRSLAVSPRRLRLFPAGPRVMS